MAMLRPNKNLWILQLLRLKGDGKDLMIVHGVYQRRQILISVLKCDRLFTFFLLILGDPDLLQVRVAAVGVGAALFRKAEGHDLLEEDGGDADGQRHQVDLEVVLDGNAANRSFFAGN